MQNLLVIANLCWNETVFTLVSKLIHLPSGHIHHS